VNKQIFKGSYSAPNLIAEGGKNAKKEQIQQRSVMDGGFLDHPGICTDAHAENRRRARGRGRVYVRGHCRYRIQA
jgi:hypothetical protein